MDCENCRHLTVVGLHDTGPRTSLADDLFGGLKPQRSWLVNVYYTTPYLTQTVQGRGQQKQNKQTKRRKRKKTKQKKNRRKRKQEPISNVHYDHKWDLKI